MAIKNNFTFHKKRVWAGLLLAQFLLFYVLSTMRLFVNLFNQLFELKKELHQRIFANFPFSVGDVFYIIIVSLLIFNLFKISKKENRNKYLLKTLMSINVLYFIYQCFWGMLYFQQPISDKLPKSEVTTVKLKMLTEEYLNRCKKSRDFVNEDQNGVFRIRDQKAIENEILKNQHNLPIIISDKKPTQIHDFKPSIFEPIMSYTGIFGYYNPFSAEAQHNALIPSTYQPFTLAHESAHQLGFAREQEANFIGFLIGDQAENLDLKYSTEYFVLKSLLNALVENDPEYVKEILLQYSFGMQRDRAAEKAFIKAHEGIIELIFGYTNDLFLKTNQQEGSITYNYFINLLIQYQHIRNDSK